MKRMFISHRNHQADLEEERQRAFWDAWHLTHGDARSCAYVKHDGTLCGDETVGSSTVGFGWSTVGVPLCVSHYRAVQEQVVAEYLHGGFQMRFPDSPQARAVARKVETERRAAG